MYGKSLRRSVENLRWQIRGKGVEVFIDPLGGVINFSRV
jgi:hypothetical protein